MLGLLSLKMKVIAITGAVGTGKTTLAKKLSKFLKFKYIDVDEVIKKYKLAEWYDRKRKSWAVDEKRLAKVLTKIIKSYRKDLVIDSHFSHYISPEYVNLCIVTKCNLKELKKRLSKKRYHRAKIDENLQVEIFDIILIEALDKKHKVRVIETDKKYNLEDIKKLL